jgi:L-threonylcarbamoyladenylate synthase
MFTTEILDLSSPLDCDKAAKLLLEGELVAIPTETVYGLAADARNKEAINKIFEVKQRPSTHPLIVHIADIFELEKWAVDIPEIAYRLAKAFWPGPLTMVLKKANHVPIEISGGLQTIAIRVPNQLKLLGLMKQHHLALVAPSANPHKKLSPTKAEHVYKSLYGRIPAVLDGGSCKVGLESTILDLTQGYPIILRKGPITKDDLEKILGTDVIDPISHSIPSPGNMHLHYQPYTKSYLVQKSEFENTIKQHLNKPVGFLHYSFYQSLVHHPYSIKLEEIKENYASALYSSLHHLDSLNLSAIYIEAPPTEPKWGAVQDRLIKATNSF